MPPHLGLSLIYFENILIKPPVFTEARPNEMICHGCLLTVLIHIRKGLDRGGRQDTECFVFAADCFPKGEQQKYSANI